MIALLCIYFLINGFFAGYIFNDDSPWYNVVTASLFGCFILLYLPIDYIAKETIDFFQLKFWWSYLFTHGWRDLDKEKLHDLNVSTKKYNTSNSVKDKIFRYCIELINNRNNYTYSRCCGRCDGVNDLCVTDQVCEDHNAQGCEICFGPI